MIHRDVVLSEKKRSHLFNLIVENPNITVNKLRDVVAKEPGKLHMSVNPFRNELKLLKNEGQIIVELVGNRHCLRASGTQCHILTKLNLDSKIQNSDNELTKLKSQFSVLPREDKINRAVQYIRLQQKNIGSISVLSSQKVKASTYKTEEKHLKANLVQIYEVIESDADTDNLMSMVNAQVLRGFVEE